MRVYEVVSVERKTEMLSHLLMLSRTRLRERPGAESEVRRTLSPDLITNIRQFGYTPSPRQLHAISQSLGVTIGGAFKLFGYSLESIRGLDFLLNGTRTRFIEDFPFYRDRPVDLPENLGDASSLRKNSFLSELVRSWRRDVPIRAIRGPHWSRGRILYAQVGTGDGMGLPRIPPGSVVAIGEIKEDERKKPNPERYYFLQHRTGYSCCRCTVEDRRLLLITEGQRVGTRQEFAYPGEVRIVGRIVSFATRLPIPTHEPSPSRIAHNDMPLLLPWEHRSFSALLRAERLRFDITEAHLNRVADVLEEELGVRLSARTVRRYEQNAQQLPRTAILLAIMAVYSLRPSDVLRLLQLWPAGARKLSLTTMMRASKSAELPSAFDPAPMPEPAAQWQELLKEWGEWPTLLSMMVPHLASQQDSLLRLNQSSRFRGLDPLVGGGSVVLFDELDISPPRNGILGRDDWNRPMYVLRHSGDTSCGYLEAGGKHFALQPHPASGIPRLIFPHGQVQISGRVTAIASPL
jgi:transcriptional regulator with XRE-family HTH domain